MISDKVSWFLCLLLVAEVALAALPQLQQVHSKFQFKYSFKGPYTVNSKGQIPFWTHGGSAIPTDDQVRVCPSIKSRRGWVWAREKFWHRHWMVDISMRITGRMKNGADGMAIWFTEQQGPEGTVFGNGDMWKGLAIVLDSFDNDGLHDNPKIQAVLNDGTMRYEHASDGLRQESGSCLREFRNRPHPVKMRIIYLRGTLEVWVHDGLSLIEDDYELCMKFVTDKLPAEGYFGITAATGGLSDDHDVLKFITHSLVPFEEQKQDELKRKFDEEQARVAGETYEKRSHEFDERKSQYFEAHPQIQPDWQYEMELEQNVRVIAEMQAKLHREIQQVSLKLDMMSVGAAVGAAVGGAAEGRAGVEVSSVALELSQIKTTESNMLHQLADIRSAIDRSVPQGGHAAMSEQLQPVYETKTLVQQNTNKLEAIERHLKSVMATGGVPGPDHKCPAPAPPLSCVSPYFLVVAMLLQVAGILGYFIYRQTQERNAKKFF